MTSKTNNIKMDKYAVVDVERCKPMICGFCKAADACSKHIMEQEATGEVPLLWSTAACVGCGRCTQACPFHAVYIQHGSATLV
jgi:translation initiation factor RLI1